MQVNAAPGRTSEDIEDTWMTPQEHFMFLSVVFKHLRNWSTFTLIVLDLAATLFTPETPEVFCGHLTPPPPPSIGIVVGR